MEREANLIMIKSMTGFGKRDAQWQGTMILVEVRSVNHRFREIVTRLPKGFLGLEEECKQLVASRCSRGRIDVSISWTAEKISEVKFTVDRKVAKSYYDALIQLQREFRLAGEIDVSLLAGFREIFSVVEEPKDQGELNAVVKRLVMGALRDLDTMRAREGKAIAMDMKQRMKTIRTMVKRIAARCPHVIRDYYQRMRERLESLLGPESVQPDRLNQELALFADRCDVTEEIIRLESHLQQFAAILKQTQPVGRQLDFLLQEMGREVNTIGSKANDAEISSLVVGLKSELEKVREQVQNIE